MQLCLTRLHCCYLRNKTCLIAAFVPSSQNKWTVIIAKMSVFWVVFFLPLTPCRWTSPDCRSCGWTTHWPDPAHSENTNMWNLSLQVCGAISSLANSWYVNKSETRAGPLVWHVGLESRSLVIRCVTWLFSTTCTFPGTLYLSIFRKTGTFDVLFHHWNMGVVCISSLLNVPVAEVVLRMAMAELVTDKRKLQDCYNLSFCTDCC